MKTIKNTLSKYFGLGNSKIIVLHKYLGLNIYDSPFFIRKIHKKNLTNTLQKNSISLKLQENIRENREFRQKLLKS